MKRHFILLILLFTSIALQAQDGDCLCAGEYTFTGQIRTFDNFTSTGNPGVCNIIVCENSLYFNSDEPLSFIGYRTVYGEYGRAYGNNDQFYLVTKNGDVRYVMRITINTMIGPMTDERMAFFDKGNTVSRYQGNSFNSSGATYGGGTYNGNTGTTGTTGTGTVQHDDSCSVCYGSGNCQTCYGSGWVSSSFSADRYPCSTCNHSGANPAYVGKCWKCHGTGKK